jgi:hypothetical protein
LLRGPTLRVTAQKLKALSKLKAFQKSKAQKIKADSLSFKTTVFGGRKHKNTRDSQKYFGKCCTKDGCGLCQKPKGQTNNVRKKVNGFRKKVFTKDAQFLKRQNFRSDLDQKTFKGTH